MPSFSGLILVVAVGFGAPFVLGLFPKVRLPSVVIEIVAGIIIGQSVLGWVEVDQTIEVMSVLGLGFLLFLSGLEIDFHKLRGKVLRLTSVAYALSFGIAIVVGLGLKGLDLVDTPLLIAIILAATSLGVIIPVLKDAGEISSTFGQLVVGAGSIADFGAIILLSIFFSGEGGTGATLLLIACVFAIAIALFFVLRGAQRSRLVMADLVRQQDTTAQIRVRAAIVLLVGFASLAQAFGLEVILGTFAAGAVLTLVDDEQRTMTHPHFREKLEAIGFGFLIPIFFVTTGVRYDLDALLDDPSNLVMVPIFLLALVLVRGLPALLYRGQIDGRRVLIAGLFQSTSLPFIVAATAIGIELGLIDAAASAALIAAGLLSVLIFPALGLALLRGAPPVPGEPSGPPPEPEEGEPQPMMAM